MAWIAVDLDSTLAVYPPDNGKSIGSPIDPMVSRVKQWLADGLEIRIFTSRGSGKVTPQEYIRIMRDIHEWCDLHIGYALEVTNQKDYQCVAIYDDRAIHVEANTGRILDVNPGQDNLGGL